MLFVSIIYVSWNRQVLWSENLMPNQDSIDSSVMNLFFLVLLTTLCFKVKMLLLSMHCIAYAFGKLGYTNLHTHENSVPLLCFAC
jgi:hypothetical protein